MFEVSRKGGLGLPKKTSQTIEIISESDVNNCGIN